MREQEEEEEREKHERDEQGIWEKPLSLLF